MKKAFNVLYVAIATLLITSCSEIDEQVLVSKPALKANEELRRELTILNENIEKQLDNNVFTRGKTDQQPVDTAKIVIADIIGALHGAKDGAEAGSVCGPNGAILGAVLGGILEGAAASYLMSYQTVIGKELPNSFINEPAAMNGNELLPILGFHNVMGIYESIKYGCELRKSPITFTGSTKAIEDGMLIGFIHNEILDSLLAKTQLRKQDADSLCQSKIHIKLYPKYVKAISKLTETDEFISKLDKNKDDEAILKSFFTVFKKNATSVHNKEVIVSQYMTFVNNSNLTNDKRNRVLGAMGVAWHSYEFWRRENILNTISE